MFSALSVGNVPDDVSRTYESHVKTRQKKLIRDVFILSPVILAFTTFIFANSVAAGIVAAASRASATSASSARDRR